MNYLKKLFHFRAKDLLHLDYLALIPCIALVLFGAYNIFLSTRKDYGTHYLKMQLIFFAVGFFVMILIVAMDQKRAMLLIPVFYGLVMVLLVAVLFTDRRFGTSGWFQVGPVTVQPAELAKLAILMMTAKQVEDCQGKVNSPKNFLKIVGFALLPMILMMLQPEMGLTMVSFFIVLAIFFVMGLKLWVILGGGVLLLGSILAALRTSIIPEHWRHRLFAFLAGSGGSYDTFQLDTARISIGSGQLRGAVNPGYYNWIPVNFSDFIFAVIAENFGFLGALGVLFAFTLVLVRLLVLAKKGENYFSRAIGAGMFGLLLFSVLQNIGMTIGIMPISGITLPFVSYGGSSLVTNFMALGLVLNAGLLRGKTKNVGYVPMPYQRKRHRATLAEQKGAL